MLASSSFYYYRKCTQAQPFKIRAKYRARGNPVGCGIQILTNAILKYNRLNSKMRLSQFVAFALMLAIASCFAKNCKTFNPNNFSLCAVCIPAFYSDKGNCTPCANAKTAVPQCSTIGGGSDGVVPSGGSTPVDKDDKGVSSSGIIVLSTNTGNASVSSNVTNSSANSSSPTPNASISNASLPATPNNANTTSPNATQNSTTNTTSSNPNTNTNTTPNITTTSTPSSNASNTPKEQVKAGKSQNLSQLIFAYLPPHCCEFKIVSGIVCSACEANYVLTPSNTCEPAKNESSQKKLSSLLVSSSLPTDQVVSLQPILPLIPNSNPLPQVVILPLVPNPVLTPNSDQKSAVTTPPITPTSPAATVTVTTGATAKAMMPQRMAINDPNCLYQNRKFSLNKVVSVDNQRCAICYSGYYFALNKQLCQPNNPLCKTIDSQNNCLSCYMGYVLQSGNCILPENGKYTVVPTAANFQDQNCKRYRDNSTVCQVCSTKFYYDFLQQICVQVDPSCKTWHQIDGYCTSCYSGYTSADYDMKCKPISVVTQASIGDLDSYRQYCTKFSSKDVCTACAYRTFLSNGICLPVSQLCNEFNSKFGYCTSCYSGYVLNDGICSQAPANTNPNDPNCANFTSGTCQACNANYYVGKQGICQVVSSLCNGYNPQNGYCLDCIPPYKVKVENGECIFRP